MRFDIYAFNQPTVFDKSWAQPLAEHILYTISRNDERKQRRELGFYQCEAGRLRKGDANQFRDRRRSAFKYSTFNPIVLVGM